MKAHYFYPQSRPRKYQSVEAKSKKISPASRKRILTLQLESQTTTQLPNIPQLRKPTRPQFKLHHLKTESSDQERMLSPIAKFPASTKQRTLSDEYEDYAEHVAKNSQINQKRELRKHIYSDTNRAKPVNNFFNAYRSDTKESFMKQFDCNEEDWVKYGNRFPKNFVRIKLLGRGGFSLIWLGENPATKEVFAIKQIPNANQYKTHLKEISFCEYFFENGGKIRGKYAKHPGSYQLARMIRYETTQLDTWLFYEVCGVSIGTQLYDFSSEMIGEKKIYKLHVQKLSKLFRANKQFLFKVIEKLAECIDLLQSNDIVHSDLKSENILIYYDMNSPDWNVKLIDYGSSFSFTKLHRQFSMATPEYMCPELLDFIIQENGSPKILPGSLDATYNRPWVIDVWGLGCVLLEIISGLPLWMSLETLVTNSLGQQRLDTGLFAVKGRYFDKIIQKQVRICSQIDESLKERVYSGIELDEKIIFLLKGMLQINPAKRFHPEQII